MVLPDASAVTVMVVMAVRAPGPAARPTTGRSHCSATPGRRRFDHPVEVRRVAGLLGILDSGGDGGNELVLKAADARGRRLAGRRRGTRRLRPAAAGGRNKIRLARVLDRLGEQLVKIGIRCRDAVDPRHDSHSFEKGLRCQLPHIR